MTIGATVFLWSGPVLQFVLILVFLDRRVFISLFPAFYRYTCCAVVANVLENVFLQHSRIYYWVYWASELTYGVLALLAMQEVFAKVWDLKQEWRRSSVWLLLVTLATGAIVWGLLGPHGPRKWAHFNASLVAFMAEIYAVEVMLAALAFQFVRKLTKYHLGIMLGFGVSAAVQVLAFAGSFFHGGPWLREVVTYAPLSAYLSATGIWLSVFLSPPRVRMKLDPEATLKWLGEQEKIARQISEGLGLKRPEDKKNRLNVE